MRNGEHNNYKIQTKQAKEPKANESKAKKANWPNVDPKKARELKTYIETATFGEIMGSAKHRRNTNEMTFRTTSNKLCYWCLTEKCLCVRTYHSDPKNKGLPRDELDRRTMNRCAVYNRKQLEAYIKETEKET